MRQTIGRICLVLAAGLSLGPVSAGRAAAVGQHEHYEGAGSIPAEVLRRPVSLRTGIGSTHEKVTTPSKDAQAFYDQGLAYLHSYVWIEAARSFNQSLRHDPKLAMAYVGLSRAYSGLGSSMLAVEAAQKAASLAQNGSTPEQLRVQLRSMQLDAMANQSDAAKHTAYKKALDDALGRYPDNVELWLLRGNAEEPSPGGTGQRGGESSISYYAKGLALSPENFAAHHYLTHSLENAGRIQEALQHGEAYARLAPAVPHAHHMYGHDLRRVGRISDAIAEFRKADELENAYYKAENILPEYDWHHEHNLDLLSTSYQYIGQMKTAEQLMRKSFELPSTQENLEFNKKEWPAFLLSRGRAKEALAAANMLAASKSDPVSAIGHIMASHSYMSMNDLPSASNEAKSALTLLRAMGKAAAPLGVYMQVLQGEFFLRTGQMDNGRNLLKEVERKVRAEPGPDAWTQALFTLESIARMARESGDWELAEYTANQMAEHDSAYAGTHYALALAAQHKGDGAASAKEFAQAAKYWRDADPDLPELLDSRRRTQP
jgi:tetratricopeptide (TPR) repeat protein